MTPYFSKILTFWRNVEKFLAILALKAPIFDAFHWKTPYFCALCHSKTPFFDAICHRKTPTSEVLGGPGGARNFFQVGVCGLDFRKCRACELIFASEKGGLRTENFQIWGLVSWKKSKFGGLWAKIWVKIEAVEAKISKFSQKGVLWTDSFAWNGTLANYRRGVKRGSSGPHIPIPPF